MIAREMIAEKVFAESVAKDIRNFLPEKYENAEFQVMQMNKNNGVQMIGVQVRLQEENVCPVVYVGSFFNFAICSTCSLLCSGCLCRVVL